METTDGPGAIHRIGEQLTSRHWPANATLRECQLERYSLQGGSEWLLIFLVSSRRGNRFLNSLSIPFRSVFVRTSFEKIGISRVRWKGETVIALRNRCSSIHFRCNLKKTYTGKSFLPSRIYSNRYDHFCLICKREYIISFEKFCILVFQGYYN